MRTRTTLLIIFFTITLAKGQQSDITGAKYYLNDKEIAFINLELINSDNIIAINLIKATSPPQFRVTTKPIEVINYKDLTDKFKIRNGKKMILLVDNKEYKKQETFLIDSSLIKDMRLTSRRKKIEITTIRYSDNRKKD